MDRERAEREASFSRRALLQAGWTAPVVLAVALPDTASAAAVSGHTDNHADHTDHSDTGHTDLPFNDGFVDHNDHTDHADHGDVHADIHQDLGHVDFEDD